MLNRIRLSPQSAFLMALHSSPADLANYYGIDDDQEKKELAEQLALVKKWTKSAQKQAGKRR